MKSNCFLVDLGDRHLDAEPNCISFFILFIASSLYIKFEFQKINIHEIGISVAFGVLTLVLSLGFGSSPFEFSYIISTWTLVFYIVGFFIMQGKKALDLQIILFIGFLIGIIANTLELIITFFDVRKEIDPLRIILTDLNLGNNICAIVCGFLYCACFYLSEMFLTKNEHVIHFLPYFSAICFVLNLIAGIITFKLKEIGILKFFSLEIMSNFV